MISLMLKFSMVLIFTKVDALVALGYFASSSHASRGILFNRHGLELGSFLF